MTFTEQTLFDWLKENKYSDLRKSNNDKSRWDCVSDNHSLIIELKCRKKHYDSLIIEKGKFDALLFLSFVEDYTPLYINSTPKGVYSFNLLEFLDVDFKGKNFPKTTQFSNNLWVKKDVAYLEVSSSICLLTM